jgi:hypothetical protein
MGEAPVKVLLLLCVYDKCCFFFTSRTLDERVDHVHHLLANLIGLLHGVRL